MRLLAAECFAHVFAPFRGLRVGVVPSIGNCGDAMIDRATGQLLDEFRIQWLPYNPDRPVEVDELLFGGGGNMGPIYQNNVRLRARLLATGLPVSVLPQSFNGPEPGAYRRIYVRESASLRHCPAGIPAPDLALGMSFCPPEMRRRKRLGVFLRRDREGIVRRRWRDRDPIRVCRSVDEYLRLAAGYEAIVTDRLHFAICGLMAGAETTLLPNSYWKNRSMYVTWLANLGCHWADSLEEALAKCHQRTRRPTGLAFVTP